MNAQTKYRERQMLAQSRKVSKNQCFHEPSTGYFVNKMIALEIHPE